jgi:hypothetical protein
MPYVVVAPLVLARDQEGRTHHRYAGEVIEWLPADLADHLESLTMVRRLGGGEAPSEPDGKPAKVAIKAVLVDWLLAQGGYDRAELEDQTKDELWALIEATD